MSARMALNPSGQMIEKIFLETVDSFDGIIADKYVIMPNHFHCIIVSQRRVDTRSTRTKSLSSVVQAFKSKTTFEYIKRVKAGLLPPFNKQIWQRNYYEHVIRNEDDYLKTWKYIDENPVRWAEDTYCCDKGNAD